MKTVLCCICLLIYKLRKKPYQDRRNPKKGSNIVLPSFQVPVMQINRKSTIVKVNPGVPMQGIAAPIYMKRDYSINPVKMIEQSIDIFQLGSKGPSPIDSFSFSLDDQDQLVSLFQNRIGIINKKSETSNQK